MKILSDPRKSEQIVPSHAHTHRTGVIGINLVRLRAKVDSNNNHNPINAKTSNNNKKWSNFQWCEPLNIVLRKRVANSKNKTQQIRRRECVICNALLTSLSRLLSSVFRSFDPLKAHGKIILHHHFRVNIFHKRLNDFKGRTRTQLVISRSRTPPRFICLFVTKQTLLMHSTQRWMK